MTAWVVDDRPEVAEALAALLSAEGVEALAVSGVAGARARLREGEEPSVMLLDLSMPGNGNAALADLAADPLRTFPVLVLTGREELLDEAVRCRAAAVLPKTVLPAELVARVKGLLGKRGGP